ncbi:hypothetical protein PRIPAC_71984 [Pristionchus pacificus]|uniref:Uncharacterized protein n=1 Tax=Pristionchus pacificus TaxID=54126 RepID=A0A2A6C0S4_PRIPA|nr:hypothetical protein PRIPAC_71984 [Pristionchus pacificus]|eukprot:PDM71719.1 hypothetical protein PRIPAC_38126 [Pristionchus pacificus]
MYRDLHSTVRLLSLVLIIDEIDHDCTAEQRRLDAHVQTQAKLSHVVKADFMKPGYLRVTEPTAAPPDST